MGEQMRGTEEMREERGADRKPKTRREVVEIEPIQVDHSGEHALARCLAPMSTSEQLGRQD